MILRTALCMLGTALLACCAGAQKLQGASSAAEPTGTPLMTGFQFEWYDCGERQWSLKAAQGSPGLARIGFFQTALIPTLELDDVTIEGRGVDGLVVTRHFSKAVMNWVSKSVSTPEGATILQIGKPSPALPTGRGTSQSFCLG